MKRLIILTVACLTVMAAAAQAAGLRIGELFDGRYGNDPSVSQTLLSGDNSFLRSHKLTTFATFRGPEATYEKILRPMVLADGSKAESRNVRYSDGKLSYAFFALPPVSDKSKDSRYIYYINPVGKKKEDVMLVYFDGPIGAEDASKLISRFANPTSQKSNDMLTNK